MQASIKKLAIISGSGSLPIEICNSCIAQNIEFLAILIKGNATLAEYSMKPSIELELGQIGKLLNILASHKISHVILAGAIKKPSLTSIEADFEGKKFFTKIQSSGSLGDNYILTEVLSLLESYGYKIVGIQDYFRDLLVPSGPLTDTLPQDEDLNDIKLGKIVAENLGVLDIGQSVIVESKVILGVEAVEGTDNLIIRSKKLKFLDKKSGVLVKVVKPNQDLRVDLPAIGPKTIKNIAKANLNGIAITANRAIIVDKFYTLALANKYKIFILGL